MAVLASCWVIIEAVIIPDGFRKWFYLSFFIHPSILFFCQIFLWLKLLIECLFVVLVFPFRVTYVLCLYIFRPIRKCVMCFYSIIRLNRAQAQEEVEQYFEAQQTFDLNEITTNSYVLSTAASIRCKVKLLEFQEAVFEERINHEGDHPLLNENENENVDKAKFHLCDATSENKDFFRGVSSFTMNDDLNGFVHQVQRDNVEGSILFENAEAPVFYVGEDRIAKEFLLCGSNSFVPDEYSNVKTLPLCGPKTPDRGDQYMDEYSPNAYPSDFQLIEREALGEAEEEEEEESDGLYKVYAERMRWFDVLNYDRTCGISAIENNPIGTPSPLKSIEYPGTGFLRISWSKMTTRKLLRSLENDFEMVYVAQSCLSWKALNHQYTKVKALEFSSSQNSTFCSYVAGEFQKFQILLERFMENEQSEGKRVWNYVHERFSLKGLLQVPEVSVRGLMKEDMKGEGTNINGVLKVIEECIQAFWLFVKTDNSNKSWWKIKTSSWTYPPVEDPRDLELLADLTKRLQKNKLWLKDLEGKKRCLLKRIVNPLEESQRREMLFTMIDMKLVSRVLQMPMISSAQLKWCQEKLDNVEFKDGKVIRACTDTLFPP